MKNHLIVAAAALLAGTGAAHAQTNAAAGLKGWYVGASVGQSNVDWDAGALAGKLSSLGYSAGSVTTDRRDTAWRAFAGYRYGANLAAEVGYTDFGRTGWNAKVAPPAGTFASSADLASVDLDALLLWPVRGIEPFVRLGVGYTDLKTSISTTGAARATSGASERGLRLRYGVGAQASFGSLGVRAEWTMIGRVGSEATGGKVDSQLGMVSAIWRF